MDSNNSSELNNFSSEARRRAAVRNHRDDARKAGLTLLGHRAARMTTPPENSTALGHVEIIELSDSEEVEEIEAEERETETAPKRRFARKTAPIHDEEEVTLLGRKRREEQEEENEFDALLSSRAYSVAVKSICRVCREYPLFGNNDCGLVCMSCGAVYCSECSREMAKSFTMCPDCKLLEFTPVFADRLPEVLDGTTTPYVTDLNYVSQRSYAQRLSDDFLLMTRNIFDRNQMSQVVELDNKEFKRLQVLEWRLKQKRRELTTLQKERMRFLDAHRRKK